MRLEKSEFMSRLTALPYLTEELRGYIEGVKSSYYEYNDLTKELCIDEVWVHGIQLYISY